MAQSLWKASWWFLIYKTKHEITTQKLHSWVLIYPSKMKIYVYITTYMKMFRVVLFIIAKKWKQCKCLSINEWINKMCPTHSVKYSAIKRNKLNDIGNNLDDSPGYYPKGGRGSHFQKVTYTWVHVHKIFEISKFKKWVKLVFACSYGWGAEELWKRSRCGY